MVIIYFDYFLFQYSYTVVYMSQGVTEIYLHRETSFESI